MTDQPETERTTVTRRDLIEQNIGKVFSNGYASDKEDEDKQVAALVQQAAQPVAARPEFGVSEKEADAAKMLSMTGPLIPEWLRGNIGACWGMIQLSKRWTRYSPRTNSWVHFDPLVIAGSTYLVRSDKSESVGFMSVFIRALIDAFAPLKTKLRYEYSGESQERQCTVIGLMIGETQPLVYTTPPLKLITPKKSPLWSSDPDRQLAYYGSRAWGRLYCADILHGVYDEDELEGDRVARAKDVTPADTQAALHERLAARAKEGASEGFRPGVVEAGLKSEVKKATRQGTGKAAGAKKAPAATQVAPRAAKLTSEAGTKAEPPAPSNPTEYRGHVVAWAAKLTTEEAIEEQWRLERQMRNQCGVTEEDRKVIRAEVLDQRILEVRQ